MAAIFLKNGKNHGQIMAFNSFNMVALQSHCFIAPLVF